MVIFIIWGCIRILTQEVHANLKLSIIKVFEYLDRNNIMHKMVLKQRTGTPMEYAHLLGISRTTLYEMIDELRSRGAQIVYSKASKTLYYTEPFEILTNCYMHPLTFREEKNLSGGIYFNKILLFRTLLALFSS